MSAYDRTSPLKRLREKLRERPMRTELEPVRQRLVVLLEEEFAGVDPPRIIQVVGSNGKGSVVHYLSGLLSDLDRSVVSYTSPHLHGINERIKLDNNPMEIDRLGELIRSFPEDLLGEFTPFESLLLCTVKAALERNAEYLILEAGMGGRWDATSALDPEWVILTSLDREHTEYLGSNLTEILREKLAQVPENGRLLSGYFEGQTPQRLLRELVAEKKLTHLSLGSKPPSADIGNRRLALLMGRRLVDRPSTELWSRLETIPAPPGRQERVTLRNRTVLFDVAHTPRAFDELVQTIEKEVPRKRRYLLYGSLEGKETGDIIPRIQDCFESGNVILTKPDSSRALDPITLRDQWNSGTDEPPRIVMSPREAFIELVNRSAPEDTIVVAGSFHLVGELRSP